MSINHLIDGEASVTPIAIAAMAQTSNPRLRQVMASFVQHMHAFIRDVDLTEAEFDEAVRFLVGIGQHTNDCHNEVILAADVLGISTLVALRNNPEQEGQTAAALLGPFWRANSPVCRN